jgi:hypothetical protein
MLFVVVMWRITIAAQVFCVAQFERKPAACDTLLLRVELKIHTCIFAGYNGFSQLHVSTYLRDKK